MSKLKIAVYIDGFNYYYAILDYMRNNPNRQPLKWLDYRSLIENHILKNSSYSKTDLKINFYSAINGFRSNDSKDRHNIYINALKIKKINVILGYYKLREVSLNCHLECDNCNKTVFVENYTINKMNNLICSKCKSIIDISQKNRIKHPEEKQTDTNIAKDILIDATQNKFDTCYLFSTDSDFVPVADYVVNECKKKFIVVAPDIKIIKKTNDKSEYRYAINQFTGIGADEYRLKMGRLARYLLPNKVGNITKPITW